MRRLARLCFFATLCAVSGPALAANDGFMILGLQETQAPASAPADVRPVPAPAQGERSGGLIGLLLNGGASEQAVASLATEPAPEGEPEPQFQRQEVDYGGPEAPGTTRPTGSYFWSSRTERRCATASGSGGRALNGRAPSGSAARPNGRTGRRRRRCCCAALTCRAIWPAVPTIRSAPEPSTSGPRSTGFMAPTSRRRLGTTFRQAASE